MHDCQCDYQMHTPECKAKNEKVIPEFNHWHTSPDALADIIHSKLYCSIHGSGFYGDCEVCLQVEIRDLLQRLQPRKPLRTK